MTTHEVPNQELNRLHDFQTLLMDLDRCPHGRHEGDACFSCPNEVSAGNPHVHSGQVIGYTISRGRITMPTRDRKHDPSNWRST